MSFSLFVFCSLPIVQGYCKRTSIPWPTTEKKQKQTKLINYDVEELKSTQKITKKIFENKKKDLKESKQHK